MVRGMNSAAHRRIDRCTVVGRDGRLSCGAEIYRGADALASRSLGQVMWAWKILVSQAGRYPLNVEPKLLKPLAVA